MLFFIEAACGGDNLNWFVRAKHPRQAFEFWRKSSFVQTMSPSLEDVDGMIKVWRAPDPSGELGPVDWLYADAWEGLEAKDFPEVTDE